MRVANHQSLILVLGMHRSGTSALTRVINLLGATLSPNLLPQAPDNQRGFWESVGVRDANEAVLEALGSAWYDFAPLPAEAAESPGLAEPLENLARVLDRDLPQEGLAVLKDPRLCRLAPLVLPLLARQGREVKVAFIHRHPWEVARSLELRNGFDQDLSLLLWLRHTVDAEAHTRELPRAMCAYEEILKDWAAVARRLGNGLGLTWPVEPDQARFAVEAFVSPGMRHHHAGHQDAALPATPLGRTAARVQALLLESGGDFACLPAQAFDEIRAQLDQAAALCAPLVLRQAGKMRPPSELAKAGIRTLSSQYLRLAEAMLAKGKELEHITTSRIWRATLSLRLVAGRLKRWPR
ncbi:MAG: hypothetical protein KMY53_05220 [Desulfarculus sp.]|nr:hypothetical protein [Pseudomonadota bacterium]MBV1717694.1 hypothetical protein [Desulfarculus sp.]MBU4573306.1 hypothetical protein [Pseudomonadota bacterium]MBU4599235.1 hypothetical protein [Pseudomonadota bacterium]MBV1737542.1 hypothetical protein [Desulfarculus sp.]